MIMLVKAVKGGRTAPRKVKYSVRLPGAEEVILTGGFTSWDPNGIPLHHGGRDEWYATLELVPGEHEYRLRVDGEWRDDPFADQRVPNSFGTQNCVLKID